MSQIRIQASDLQDDGLEGNLNKFRTVANHTNSLVKKGKNVPGVDLAGDLFDMHLIYSYLAKVEKAFFEDNPEALEIIQKGELTQEDWKKLSSFPGFDEVIGAKVPGLIGKIYQTQEEILSGIQTDVYGVTGNNDARFIKDVVNSVKFTDLEGRLVENGPFTILGANNTNYPEEEAFPGALAQFAFPSDDDADLEKSVAYQKYNIGKTKKKANIFLLHGPPNSVEMRGKHDNSAKGISKLIEEHKPDLVECGHFHSARIVTKDGVTYARTSPNIYFEHHFNDGGRYQFTEIYRYQRAA